MDGSDVTLLSESERAWLRSRRIGFVFQNFNLLPRLSALENVMMPFTYGGHEPTAAACRDRARELLERVGLGDRLDHEPARLSGGEQQRVAIARALINRCALLIADEPTGNLDSRTGEEILALFRQLNREDGLTIVLVTHDASVAAHAGRIVRIRDGLVHGEEGSSASPAPALAAPPAPTPSMAIDDDSSPAITPPDAGLPRRGLGAEFRFVARTSSTAMRSLRRNPLRSALTTLGIIIGVGSLLAIAEIGTGAWSAIRVLLTKTGVDNIVVQAGAASRNGVSLGSGSIKTLTPEDADSILHECPSVDSLSPLVFTRKQVVNGNKNWVPSTFVGTTPGYLRVREWEDLEEGEPFTDRDVRDVAMVCLLGQTVARELFGEGSPVGQRGLRQRRPPARPGRSQPQGGRHRRRGPGRPDRRTLDDDQVPGQLGRWRRRRRCRPHRRSPRPRGPQVSGRPHPALTDRIARPQIAPRPGCTGSRTSTRSWSARSRPTRSRRRWTRSLASCGSGTASAPAKPTISPSATSPRSSTP